MAPLKEWMYQDMPSALWTSFQQSSGCLRKVDSTTRMWVDGFPDVHSLIDLSTSFSPWDTSRESSQGRHRNNLSRNMAWKFCHFSCLTKKWSVCCSLKLCHIVYFFFSSTSFHWSSFDLLLHNLLYRRIWRRWLVPTATQLPWRSSDSCGVWMSPLSVWKRPRDVAKMHQNAQNLGQMMVKFCWWW